MINPANIFSTAILNYKIDTIRRGHARYVNLDNAATTPPLLAVEKAVSDFIQSYGSVHRGAGAKSRLSTQSYERARETIKQCVNAPKGSYVILTGNTTGAMNMAAHFFSQLEGKIAVSPIEHSSSWLPWVVAEGQKAIGDKQVPLSELSTLHSTVQELGHRQVLKYAINDKWEFDLNSIEQVLSNNQIKALVVTASSNLTGYTPEIRPISELAHKHGALLVLDACQYIQHHPLDMEALGIDLMAASGHKFYAPYGGGFLIGPKYFFDCFLPYQIGGGNLPYITQDGTFLRYLNEQAHDPGTPNSIGAISMAAALTELKSIGLKNVEQHERSLALKAYRGLAANSAIQLHVTSSQLTTVLPFTVRGVHCRTFADELNKQFGIGVRAGSFCVYDAIRQLLRIEDETPIIDAVKQGDQAGIPGIIRASFGLCNTENDVELLIDAVNYLTRTLSPQARDVDSANVHKLSRLCTINELS